MLTTRFLAGALALVCFTLAVSSAEARHRHYRHHYRAVHQHAIRTTAGMVYTNDGRILGGGTMPEFSSLLPMITPSAPSSHPAAYRSGHGNLCTAQGRCATVASFAIGAFRGLVADLEHLGYAIGSPGCLSGGHMRNSKHHWGGACDLFNQVARNRTALRQPPPAVQIEVAQRHGLISGCSWHRSPDCGHFEVARR